MRKLKHAEIEVIRKKLQLAQGNKCAICDADFTEAKLKGKKLVPKYVPTLDHDHDTGVIRGVLCSNCNGNEGRIRKRALSSKRTRTYLQWLRRMVEYLESHLQPKTSFIHPLHKTDDQKRLLKNKKARQRAAAARAVKLLSGKGN